MNQVQFIDNLINEICAVMRGEKNFCYLNILQSVKEVIIQLESVTLSQELVIFCEKKFNEIEQYRKYSIQIEYIQNALHARRSDLIASNNKISICRIEDCNYNNPYINYDPDYICYSCRMKK